MTAEIAVLNCSAVALAADSAVTVAGSKVYNTVNKLFALSYEAPVGVMVYGSAMLCGVPWETLIKEFRTANEGVSYDTLHEYGDALKAFICNGAMIDAEIQKAAAFQSALRFYANAVYMQFEESVHAAFEKDGELSEESAIELLRAQVQEFFVGLSGLDVADGWSEEDLPGVRDEYGDSIEAAISVVFESLPLDDELLETLRALFAQFVVRAYFTPNVSGIVFAGFGDADTFPGLVSFEFDGVYLSKLKWRDDVKESTGPNSRAVIRPFAQREMVDLFMSGIDPAYSETIEKALTGFVAGLPAVISDAAHADEATAAQIRARMELGAAELLQAFRDELASYSFNAHIGPIIDAVASLPKDELGAMAEALVNLTSFKRRVTLDAETVGGAVDVAVISKGDGLIWLKRKHYFDTSSNPQYLSRFNSGG